MGTVAAVSSVPRLRGKNVEGTGKRRGDVLLAWHADIHHHHRVNAGNQEKFQEVLRIHNQESCHE